MKAGLQLQVGQHLALTPQLQQAIRLLQLSSLDLQQEIQSAVESNPMLDFNEENTEKESDHPTKTTQAIDIENGKPVSSTVQDHQTSYTGSRKNSTGEAFPIDQISAPPISLQDQLLWQLQISSFSATDEAIAEAIIDAIDEQGFLKSSLEDIRESVENEAVDIELDEVEAVLQRVQIFEPLGVGARDLQECLLLQIKQYPEETPYLSQAIDVLTHHFEPLAKRDKARLQRKAKLSEEELFGAIELIQQLDPRPGRQVESELPEYVVPDVVISRHEGQWLVQLNQQSLPRLQINNQYSAMVKQPKDTRDKAFLRDHLQEARWFIKSLESRNQTLLKVSRCIFEHQQKFLEQGEEHMRPLTLNQIAEAVDMHESTISRVTTQKYVETPRGVFELKYFFSSHVATSDGGTCSATAIQAHIKKLVSEETSNKPLSDSQITQCLQERGIKVARRTIAKYREILGIPPSNERRRLR